MTRQIKSIIIHCAATPNGRHFSVNDIDRWHRERGFKRSDQFRQWQNPNLAAIGYHFVIYTNGAVATGRHLDEVGAHAQGFNSKSIGVCLIGTDKFTMAQWRSLRSNVCALAENIALLWGDEELVKVLGHRDLPGCFEKNSPGFSVADWLETRMQPLSAHLLDESEIADNE